MNQAAQNQTSVITTAGESNLDVDPELAELYLTIAAQEPDRTLAVRKVTERAAQAKVVLDSYSAAIERTETGGVSVYPQYKDGNNRIIGYQASLSSTVRVTDFAVLGEMLGALGRCDGASFHGPNWRLRDNSEHYRAARLAAVEDALRRARDYAAALGTQVTGLIELADSGLLSGGNADHGGGSMMMARGFAGAAGMSDAAQPAFDLQPARQSVTARIEARFSVQPPDLANRA